MAGRDQHVSVLDVGSECFGARFRCSILDTHRPDCTDNSAQASSQPLLMAYIRYTTPTVQISLFATYSTTEQPLDPTEATRAVPCSHNYHYCDCCRCPVSVLTVYKPPTDHCRCDATLQIDREWGLTSSCDTCTDANLRDNYLTMSGSDPNHRDVGRQTVSCTTCPPCTMYHPPPAQL